MTVKLNHRRAREHLLQLIVFINYIFINVYVRVLRVNNFTTRCNTTKYIICRAYVLHEYNMYERVAGKHKK